MVRQCRADTHALCTEFALTLIDRCCRHVRTYIHSKAMRVCARTKLYKAVRVNTQDARLVDIGRGTSWVLPGLQYAYPSDITLTAAPTALTVSSHALPLPSWVLPFGVLSAASLCTPCAVAWGPGWRCMMPSSTPRPCLRRSPNTHARPSCACLLRSQGDECPKILQAF